MRNEQAIAHSLAIPTFETALRLGAAARWRAERVERWPTGLPLFARHRWRRVRLRPQFGRWHELPWRGPRRHMAAGYGAAPAAVGRTLPRLPAGGPGAGVSRPSTTAAMREVAVSPSGKSQDRPGPISVPALSLQWPAVVRAKRHRSAAAAPTMALVTLLRMPQSHATARNSNAIRLPAANRARNAAVEQTHSPAARVAMPVGPSAEPLTPGSAATVRDMLAIDLRTPARSDRHGDDYTDAPHLRSREPVAGHQPLGLPVRTRADLISGVATSLYDRLRAEITVMRTILRQEVTERIDAAETARASVTAPQPAHDPREMLQDVRMFDVLSRRMRSLGQEERFRLGRLR